MHYFYLFVSYLLYTASLFPTATTTATTITSVGSPILHQTSSPNLQPRTSPFITFIALGISHTRDTYLGASPFNIKIARIGPSANVQVTISCLWEAVNGQWFIITTKTKPNSPRWNPPAQDRRVELSELANIPEFDWGDVTLEYEEAASLAGGEGFKRARIFQPVQKPKVARSRLFYLFEEAGGGLVWVGVEEREVLRIRE